MSWLRRETPETKALNEKTSKLERARFRRKIAVARLIDKLDQFEDKDGTPPFLEKRSVYKNGSGHGHDD